MDPKIEELDIVTVKGGDVDGIRIGRRGMERIPIIRPDKTNKAALGKSRRLMSSCIKQQPSFTHESFSHYSNQ